MRSPVVKSLQEYARGIIGGFLFSLPILYTMEVWWRGMVIGPSVQVVFLVITFILLLGYNRYAGLREDASWKEVIIDSVEEIGIGLMLATFFLWIIGVLDFRTMELPRIISMVVVETMTVAIGVSVGTAQLGDTGEEEGSGMAAVDSNRAMDMKTTPLPEQMILSLCASVLFAANIAPTEEVLQIAVAINPLKALLLCMVSILFSGVVLFFIAFKGSEGLQVHQEAGWKEIVPLTFMTYNVALISSAGALALFGQFEGVSFEIAVYQTVALGVASSLGATAGRLLLK